MNRRTILTAIPAAALLALSACAANVPGPGTMASNIANSLISAIALEPTAMACYQTVKAATSASNTVSNVVTGTAVLAAPGPCQMLATDAAALVASAINAGVTPTPSGTAVSVAATGAVASAAPAK